MRSIARAKGSYCRACIRGARGGWARMAKRAIWGAQTARPGPSARDGLLGNENGATKQDFLLDVVLGLTIQAFQEQIARGVPNGGIILHVTRTNHGNPSAGIGVKNRIPNDRAAQ